MKTLRKIGIVLMSVFMIAGLGACGDDDDDSNGNGQGGNDNSVPSVKCPDGNHPHLIDMGLPSGTKWACCNVGASAPQDKGGYYAWGETEESAAYNADTYLYYNSKNGWIHIGDDISGTEYDVARAKWGAPWRMPSLDEMKELRDKCAHEWTRLNGVNGIHVTGPNGNSVFLPAAGNRWGENLYSDGSYGCYWSGTLDTGKKNNESSGNSENSMSNTYGLGFDPNGWYWGSYYGRYYGFSVRPVAK